MTERLKGQGMEKGTVGVNLNSIPRLERILPEDPGIVVGKPYEVLKKAIPYFGEENINALIRTIEMGTPIRARFLAEDEKERITRRFSITSLTGNPLHVKIKMHGWREGKETISGLPIRISEQIKYATLYRRLIPENPPLIKIGDKVGIKQALIVFEVGKKTKRIAYLPTDEFPKGGKVTAILVNDDKNGTTVKGGFTFAYIDPIT